MRYYRLVLEILQLLCGFFNKTVMRVRLDQGMYLIWWSSFCPDDVYEIRTDARERNVTL